MEEKMKASEDELQEEHKVQEELNTKLKEQITQNETLMKELEKL